MVDFNYNVTNSPADDNLQNKDDESKELNISRGNQIGLGKRVSTHNPEQQSFGPVTEKMLGIDRTSNTSKSWRALGYLMSFISSGWSTSAIKTEKVALEGSLASMTQTEPSVDLPTLQAQARELGLSEEKIAKKTNEGTLEHAVILQKKTLKHYSLILKNYEIESDKLFLKNGKSTKITSDILFKIIKISLKNNIGSEGEIITKDKQNFLVQKLKGRGIQIVVMRGDFLGKGAFGKVYEVLQVTSGQLMALKTAKGADSISEDWAKRSLKDEVQNLKLANGESSHTVGVQPKAYQFFNLAKSGEVGYLIPLYTQTLDKLAFSPPGIPQQLKYIEQTFSGLASIHKRQLVHTDIKPDNIGVTDDEAYLADFGLARSTGHLVDKGVLGLLKWAINETVGIFNINVAGGDNDWYLPSDNFAYEDALSNRDEEGAREILEKADVCALGRSAFYLLSGGKYINQIKPQELLERGVPEEAIQILFQTQNKDPLKRPSASEVQAVLTKIVAST